MSSAAVRIEDVISPDNCDLIQEPRGQRMPMVLQQHEGGVIAGGRAEVKPPRPRLGHPSAGAVERHHGLYARVKPGGLSF